MIEFDGPPGVSLFSLDADARAARQRVTAMRNALQRERDEQRVRRYRRGLPKHVSAVLDRAETEMEADHG